VPVFGDRGPARAPSKGGGAGRAPGFPALRDHAPLTPLNDLALGAFELRDDDAHRAAVRAGVLDRSLVDELRPQLRAVQAMIGARQAPTRRHLADALAEDLRGFLAHHRCARGVVLCTIPGIAAAAGKLGFTAEEVWAALEESAGWVTPGVVYAAAAAQAGCAFVAGGRDAALSAPGIPALFAERNLPIAGTGLLGPDAPLREALAQALAAEGLQLTGSVSLSTRAEEQGARTWGGADRTEEIGRAAAWAGGALELSLELRGQVALYLAARALDAALLVISPRAPAAAADRIGWTLSSPRRSVPARRTRRPPRPSPNAAPACTPSCQPWPGALRAKRPRSSQAAGASAACALA
jgi:hypothetical protein